MHKKIHLLSVFIGLSISLFAQQDQNIILQDSLTMLDIFPSKTIEKDAQVISMFGNTEKIRELPYSAYIITKEEIKDNNYVTLTDALRTVPGIFVSPLGSATEGELFMMHGLRGNRYTEIMINGMPIKPLMAPGMPIGAQLPIRQAERIEVVYGPGTGQFNSGANAGLINIVLKESDRPLFMQANLGAGDARYNSVDVFFGGKLNRGKNVLKFSAWGSTTSFNDWRFGYPRNGSVRGDSPLFRVETYDNYYGDTRFYLDAVNYSGTLDNAFKGSFPHQSKNLGIQFKYRKMEFLADFSNRRDHAALGLNPLTLAYDDPIDFYAESSTRFTFRKKQGRKRLKYGIDLSLLLYNSDPFSSFQPVQDAVGYAYEQNEIRILEEQDIIITPSIQDSIYALNQENNFAGNRYRYASFWQALVRQNLTYSVSQNYNISFSLNSQIALGLADVNYMTEPTKHEGYFFSNLQSISKGNYHSSLRTSSVGDNFILLNNHLRFSKFSADLGFKSVFAFLKSSFHPNLNLNYHPNSHFSVYFNYQSDTHKPEVFFQKNSFRFTRTGFFQLESRAVQFGLSERLVEYIPTKTRILELGIHTQIGKNIRLQTNYFYNRTDNLLRYYEGLFVTENYTNITDFYETGYSTKRNIYQKMHGLQGQITWNNFLTNRNLSSKLSFMLYRGSEHLPEENNRRINQIVEYPPLLLQWRLSYKLGKKWKIITENIYQANSRSAAFEDVTVPGGLITDLGVRYQLSRNFEIYARASNLFNTKYGGISAVEYQDALLYNPQPLLRFRFGVTYDLD